LEGRFADGQTVTVDVDGEEITFAASEVSSVS
jgi:hypothetical protein